MTASPSPASQVTYIGFSTFIKFPTTKKRCAYVVNTFIRAQFFKQHIHVGDVGQTDRGLQNGVPVLVYASVLSGVVSDMKLSITAVNGRIDKNRDAVLEASVSLTDVADVDMLLKKLRADKRIYDVHRITSLS